MKPSAFEWIARFGRDPFALLSVVLAGLGTAHILVRTATYGLVVKTDSVQFLSTAMNFLAGEGWRNFTGEPLVGWPPLFPLLLAAFGWVGLDPLEAGRWVNATAFGLTILAAGSWLRSNLRARWLALAATATLAASLPLSRWASHLRTDFLFALLTLLALVQLAAFLRRRTDAPLGWAAVCTALAALTRYPGVVLIGVGILLLGPLARPKKTLAFGAISSLPLLAVLGHNWAVAETLTGRSAKGSGQSLSAGLSQTVAVFRGWVVPPNAPEGVAYLLGLAVAAVVLAGGTVILRMLRMHRDDEEAAPAYFRLRPALPFAVFAVGYLGSMVAVVPFTVRQAIDSRYLLPVYVPLLLVAALLLDRLLSIEAAGRMAGAKWGLASLVLLGGLAHTGFSIHSNLTRQVWRAEAWVYNVSHWESSEPLNYIRTHLREGRIYSNHAPLAWFWDRTAPPGKHQYLPHKIHQVVPRIMGKTDSDGAHIVWFQDRKLWYRYDAFDIHCLPGVEPVAELSNGVVFRVTAAAEPFDAERHRTRKQRYLDQLIQQAGELVVRSNWDVYRNGRKLTYLKQPCTPADVQAKFVLHVTPVDPADLPTYRQRYGFDNFDFYFDRRGVQVGDQCIVTAHLPNYAIRRIRVGQWISDGNRTLWDAEFAPSR